MQVCAEYVLTVLESTGTVNGFVVGHNIHACIRFLSTSMSVPVTQMLTMVVVGPRQSQFLVGVAFKVAAFLESGRGCKRYPAMSYSYSAGLVAAKSPAIGAD